MSIGKGWHKTLPGRGLLLCTSFSFFAFIFFCKLARSGILLLLPILHTQVVGALPAQLQESQARDLFSPLLPGCAIKGSRSVPSFKKC